MILEIPNLILRQIRCWTWVLNMPSPGSRQTMLFSATFPSVMQKVDYVQEVDKRSHLMQILHARLANEICGKLALTLAFVETKKGAHALEYWLSMNGFPAIAIHGDKVQMERERALKSFKNGTTSILVATDVASRGLDIPHVAHVINFDLPKDIDDYVHRIGRTGRAGKSGLATAFFCDKNLPLAKALVELMQESNQEVPSWLNQNAARSTSVGQGKRYWASRFGGYDYRNAQYGCESYNYSSNYEGPDSSFDASVGSSYGASNAGPDAECYVAANADSYAPCGYGEGYESIVATGWD